MAEGLCRMMAKREGLQLEVRSAGVTAHDGAPVSRHSGEILHMKGAVEGVGASRYLRKDEVRWADLILTMTMYHKQQVIAAHPEAVEKVYTLKEYTMDDPLRLGVLEERAALQSELELKKALGQPITAEERERLVRLHLAAPDFDIADPFGGSKRDYEDTAHEIEEALARLILRLKG
jgi:protein-tyrosine phosphatase